MLYRMDHAVIVRCIDKANSVLYRMGHAVIVRRIDKANSVLYRKKSR